MTTFACYYPPFTVVTEVESVGRVQAKALAFTWSCPKGYASHPFDMAGKLPFLVDSLKAINLGMARVASYVVSRELHESGTAHYHAYVKYTSRLNVRDMRKWDVLGVHPCIKTVNDWKGWVRYVIKDGDFVSDGVDMASLTEMSKKDKSSAWAKAIALTTETCKAQDAIELLMKAQPQQWLVNSTRIAATLNGIAIESRKRKFPLPVKTTRWIKEVEEIDVSKPSGCEMSEDLVATHILVGSTGIGKTEAAKYLLRKTYGDDCRILFVNHAEDFKGQEGLFDAFVWDEACFNTPQGANKMPWSREQQIAICGHDMHPRTLVTRHSNVVIPPMTPRVFTCNFLSRCVDMNDPAIDRRVVVHDFGFTQLYV